ncbi:MAG TPA: ATP-grasp domain-containing protein [Planctomycetia bacterium]|nr:ATP-grasp domain-containing protein [Planctomycetia bacterium]
MRILLYEHLCASPPGDAASGALVREGAAMLAAALADFRAAGGFELFFLWNQRRPAPAFAGRATMLRAGDDPFVAFRRGLGMVEAALAIAPEIDGLAVKAARTIRLAGVRSLGIEPEGVAICADKLALARRFPRLFPQTESSAAALEPADRVVVKPRFGAGALFTAATTAAKAAETADRLRGEGANDLIFQPWRTGETISIGALSSGGGKTFFLPAGRQRIDREPDANDSETWRLRYAGGDLPAEDVWQARSERLGRELLSGLPGMRGYLGIDMIMGESPDEDAIVDVNPRLTTSFAAYERLFPGFLGRWSARGEVPRISRPLSKVGFTPVDLSPEWKG